MNQLPYFKMYPADFENDENVKLMSNHQRGVYGRLLNLSWLNSGIPSDPAKLASLVEEPLKRFTEKLWPAIQICWKPKPDDPTRLFNPRQEIERAQAISKSESATDAVRTRYERTSDDLPRAYDSDSSLSSRGGAGGVVDFDTLAVWLCARHRKKGGRTAVEHAIVQIACERPNEPELAALIEQRHRMWCKYWDSTFSGAQFWPKLVDWLLKGDWRDEPEGEQPPPQTPTEGGWSGHPD